MPEKPNERIRVLRILDAAANRAGEGLRVVEDYLRFAIDDRHLTLIAKELRHDLAAALSHLPSSDRHAARETQADVGTTITTPSEATRPDAASVATAGFQRAQQALRSLEEYGKTLDAALGAAFEALRYRLYTLERATTITADSAARLADARLYVLIDGRSSADELAAMAETLFAAGVDVLQLRDKQLPDRDLLGRARRLAEISRRTGKLFIMNDRPDLAVLAQADGVHAGQDELTVKDVRTIVGPRMLIGVSTHSLAQARVAVLDGANYIGVGPTFPSGTKSFAEFTGVELLRQVAAEIRLPAFAIGGISAANLDQVLAAGFSRAAISGGVLAAPDPAAAARSLRGRLASYQPEA